MYKKSLSGQENGDYGRQTPRGKSPLRRDNHSTSYVPSQRTNGATLHPQASSSNAVRSTSMQREKLSTKLNVSSENERAYHTNGNTSSSQARATSVIKSNMKQRRALAKERWNMLKHVRHVSN